MTKKEKEFSKAFKEEIRKIAEKENGKVNAEIIKIALESMINKNEKQ